MQTSNRYRIRIASFAGFAAVGLALTGSAGIHHAFTTGSGHGLFVAAASFGLILLASRI